MSTILAVIAVIVILVILFNIVIGVLSAILTNPVALLGIAVAIYFMSKISRRKKLMMRRS